MSFASDVKKELTEHTATKGTLMALIRMTGSLGITGHLTLSMVTESATTAKYIYQLFLEIYQLRADIRVHQKTTLSKNRVYTVVIEERVTELLDQLSLADSLMLETGMPLSVMESSKNQIIDDSEDYMEQEDRENLAIDYLRGAFLATGSMHNPEQGDYQLSIGSFYQEHAEDLQDILSNLGFDGKIIARKNRFILYLSKSEEIMDFLTLIGAMKARLKFEDVKIVREMRGLANRQSNFESANINKTVSAAQEVIDAIHYLNEKKELENLPEHLKEIAQLRLSHPEATIQELGQMIDPPLGKSGVNHRLRKLLALSKNKK